MSDLVQDLRYTMRTLARSPVFAAAAIVILALGVGFNTTVFSLVDAVVLRPLPGVARPGELWEIEAKRTSSVFSYPSYRDLRENSLFSSLAAYGHRALAVSGDGAAERVRAAVVSGNYFDVLGVRPPAGRFLRPGDEESGETLAVLSHGLSQRRFGRSAEAVGKLIVLNGTPFTVVGVAPPAFRGAGFGTPTDLWIPIGAWPRVATGALARLDFHRRGWSWMTVFGRLAPGISRSQAQAALDVAARDEQRLYPQATPDDYRIGLRPLTQAAAGAGHPADPVRFLAFLLGAVAVSLLVACANLANLLLARAVARRREIAVRQALGAGRGRLVRQMLTESLALSLAGGAAGLAVANWSLALLSRVRLPGDVALGSFGAALDFRVLAFALAVSMATGVLFGLLPALQATRFALLAALKDDGPGRRRRALLPGALVAAQVALCLILLSSGGLLARSLRNALAADTGFEARGVALASVQLGVARYDAARAWTFATAAARAAAALPGARSAAWAGMLPLGGDREVESVELPGEAPGQRQAVAATAVGPAYFRTIGLKILAGREFEETDLPDGAPVAVVNEAAARRFWPGRNPIGQRLRIYGAERTVVGLCRDSLFQTLRDPHMPQVAVAIQQVGGDGLLAAMTLLVRFPGDAGAASASLRSAIAALDPNLPPFGPRTLEESLGGQLVPQRFGSALLGLFAALTLVLAAVGIYAVVAGSVARRLREIGIRLALGAEPARLFRMVLAQTAAPVLAGIALGLPLAAVAARALGGFLFGVAPTDSATFGAAVAVLALAGFAAASFPARRAASLDPMTAVRHE
ncbi:MAG TPA: ABC transporter permease [Thermoanaerobaculia bacterium]|nr:ABC transporter permease [Thermoanaerobaculia bacterium]